MVRAGVDQDRLNLKVLEFKGYRGVCQLRTFVPLADPRAESMAESIMRLRWLDTSVPRPSLQLHVRGPHGSDFWLDAGLERLFFAVEYDGAEYHSSDVQRARDDWRRGWIEENTPWVIKTVTRVNVFGRQQDFQARLPGWVAEARRTLPARLARAAWTA